MIEVSLYSVPTGSDVNVSMGRCIDRTRFSKEAMGTGVMEFVKGFLKTNVSTIELAVKNPGIISFINDDTNMTTKDFACINYWLAKSGLIVKIQNVTDDEENPKGVTGESIEWNIVDYNFIQHDYPTAIKIVSNGLDVVEVLKRTIDQLGLFDSNKLNGVKNPLKVAIEQLDATKAQMGKIEPSIASKIYEILEQVGVKIFLATGE